MIKTLTAVGDGLGVVIDRVILDLLHIDKDTALELRVEGKALVIEPIEKGARERKVRSAAERVMAAHDATFRKLGK